jgi:hypothetical protein
VSEQMIHQVSAKRGPWARGRELLLPVLGLLLVVATSCASGTKSAGTGATQSNAPKAASATPVPTARTSTSPTSVPTTAQSTVPSPSSAAPKPQYATFGDGTWTVGKDIQPGTYRTRQGQSGCYWARLRDFSGGGNDTLANDNTDYPVVVTILATDAGFKSVGCSTWTADLSAITSSRTSFGDGIFIVGTDILPGTYRSSGQTGCYWGRLANFSGAGNDTLANDNTDTAATVTIAGSDKGFKSSSCGTWTKTG